MSNIFFKKNYKKNMKFFFLRIIQKYVLLLNLKTNTDIKVLFNKDVISSNILLNGVYEKELLDFNLELCKKVGKLKNFSVADIGANIGNHSLYFSNYFKKVYAFEAHPKIFSVNQLNTSNKKNIELFNFGLGDTNKNSFIYENEHNMGGSSVINKVGKKIKIKILKLDKIKKIKKLLLIKIDVEDFELQVLKGSLNTIKKFKPIIVFESWSKHNSKVSFLKKLNYKIFIVKNFNPFNFIFFKILFNLKDIIFGRQFSLIEYSEKFKKKSFDQLIAIPIEKLESFK
jgi:FkbM family methyltransferase